MAELTQEPKKPRKHRRRVTLETIEKECQEIKNLLASGVSDNKLIRDKMGLNAFQFKHRLKYIAKQGDVSVDSDHLIVQYRLRKQALLADIQGIKKKFKEHKEIKDGKEITIPMDERGLLSCVRVENELLEDEMKTLITMGVIKSAPIEVNHTMEELKSRWLEMLGLKQSAVLKNEISLSSIPIKSTSGVTSPN